jgi:hypothetical protein
MRRPIAVSTVALVGIAALLLPGATAASPDGPSHTAPTQIVVLRVAFRSCTTEKLENQGVFQLKASHATCKLARQTAFAQRRGDATPKGFSCLPGIGGNLTPYTCSRQQKIVKFSLEG